MSGDWDAEGEDGSMSYSVAVYVEGAAHLLGAEGTEVKAEPVTIGFCGVTMAEYIL